MIAIVKSLTGFRVSPMVGWSVLVVGGLLLLVGCGRQTMAPATMPEAVVVCLPAQRGWVPVTAEVAATDAQRRRGLQGREVLGTREGMVFLYPETRRTDSGFWMYQTRIPLTIAFFQKDGQIVTERDMRPCLSDDPSRCATYRSDSPYDGALEVNQGLLELLQLTGDPLMIGAPLGKPDAGCDDRVPMEQLFDRF